MSHDALEAQLRTLVDPFEAVGAHLSEERLAEISGGIAAQDAEQLHLAGCGECTELLVLLGEGLAMWSRPAPVVQLRSRRTPWLVGGLVFCGAAAAFWSQSVGSGSADVPAARPAVSEPSPALQAAVEPALLAEPAAVPEHVLAPEPAVVPERVEAPEPVAALEPAPPSAAPSEASAAPRPKPPKRPRKRAERATAPRLGHTQLAGTGGPSAVARRPINGAPRGYGYLRLTSKPPAEVWLDGKRIGWTPIIDRRLPEGPHDVQLQYPSPLAAAPIERLRVVIEADKIWKVVRRNLKR